MEGTQDAQAVLSPVGARLTLTLSQVYPAEAGWLRWAGFALLLVYYPLVAVGLGPRLAAVGAFFLWLAVMAKTKRAWPTVVNAGQLRCFDDEIILSIDEHQIRYPLDSTTSVLLTYQGFKGEPLAPRIRASGIDNFIQIDDGQVYQFAVLTEQAQQHLRTELHRWYLRKVKVKEHRRDGPTYLLHRDLSYEQIQKYKREFGVSLYG